MELVRAEYLQEVSSLAVEGNHGKGQCPAPRIDDRSAVYHDESQAVFGEERSVFWLNDLIVVKHLSWPLLLSLVEYLRGVVPVDGRHIVISATEGHVILNDPVWETVGSEAV